MAFLACLRQLLTRDPTRRLGSGEADAAEIKSHLFFKDTNWDDIFHKRVPSPFFPAIVSAWLATPFSLSRHERRTSTDLLTFFLALAPLVIRHRHVQFRFRVYERATYVDTCALDSVGARSGRVCWILVSFSVWLFVRFERHV